MSKTLNKLVDLLSAEDDLVAADIRFAARNDQLATDELTPREYRKLVRKIVAALRSMESIPSALQVECVTLYDGATRAIGELLSVEAQEAVLDEFEDDLPILMRNAVKYKHIAEALWKKLALSAKRGELSARVVKKLSARTDCPPQFLKMAGVKTETAAKQRVKETVVKTTKVRKSVKNTDNDFDDDEDFEDAAEVRRTVRKVRRPAV